ncbi:MAG: four helix bundle protein [Saprospiraceae bacterium]|nr:four helix bundle protein [Saprospiraceae bacterium]
MDKKYDLEERTFEFAVEVRRFVIRLPKNAANYEDGKQVIRSSGSIGANYIEANEKLGEKDFLHRLRIARKEAKETSYWLNIIKNVGDYSEESEVALLVRESEQLRKILSSIISKHGKK